jgi:hypothetical protein
MRFIPSAEMLEAIRAITGIDPFDKPELIIPAITDPVNGPAIKAAYDELVAAKRRAA